MISLYSHFGFNQKYFFDDSQKNIRLVIDPNCSYFNPENLTNEKKNFDKLILIHGCEPPLLNNIRDYIIQNQFFFDKIYSFDNYVLEKCSNSKLFVFGSSWILTDKNGETCYFIKDYENKYSTNKKFKLSFIRSHKKNLAGHKLRHEITDVVKKPRNFELMFPDKFIGDKKILFNDSMFHISIENSKYDNYITEKIIDCFMSFTIPIYWGCPNIQNYFNHDGIITFNDSENLSTILDNLTEYDYIKRMKAIEENYLIAKNNYAFFYDRISKMIKI